MPDSCAAFGCTNRSSTTSLQFYRIPSAKRYPVQGTTKWVTVKKISNTQTRSAHFATDRSSQFSKARTFPTILLFANTNLC